MINRFLPKLLAGTLALVGLAAAQDISCNQKPVAATTTAAQKATLLAEHNKIRKASGVTNDLVWDDKLAMFAQGYANALGEFNTKKINGGYANWPHSTNSCYGKTNSASYGAKGENIGGGNGSPESAVQAYGAEKDNFNLTAMTCNPGTVCDHWVQAVSAKVTKVGCAINANSGWVCSYDVIGAQKCSGGKYAEFIKALPSKVGEKVEAKNMMDNTWKPATITAVAANRFTVDFGGQTMGVLPPTGCSFDMVRYPAK